MDFKGERFLFRIIPIDLLSIFGVWNFRGIISVFVYSRIFLFCSLMNFPYRRPIWPKILPFVWIFDRLAVLRLLWESAGDGLFIIRASYSLKTG